MARARSSYVCQQCSYESSKWYGKCPECNTWSSLVESISEQTTRGRKSLSPKGRRVKKPVSITSVSSRKNPRILTKISELDRVLGGGLVEGQVVLIAGEPGIGKSTILLQLADKVGDTLYVSGEESVHQIALRGKRLGVKRKTTSVLEETNIDTITSLINQLISENIKPKVLIIDSIQTMVTTDLSGMAGSVGQVRECAYRLIRVAKSQGIASFIVGHVTKEGAVAGPAVLSHLVDTVLWFEGDKSITLRMLRAMKNRFGPTDEVGIFSMEEKGLISQAKYDKLFLTKSRKLVAGSSVTSVMKGTRPLLIEIQSLLVPSKFAYPRRVVQGFNPKRLEMLLAVLTSRCGLPMHDFDCFVNITGGISVHGDPSVDLAICMSVASAYIGKALPKLSVVLGEVGLLGDIREAVDQEKRIKEAKRLGFKTIISSREIKYLQPTIKKYLSKR
jgi:DNA repair protein RadA/Sms